MVPSSWSTNGCGSSSSDPQSSTQCIDSLLSLLAAAVAADDGRDSLLRDADRRQTSGHHVAEAGPCVRVRRVRLVDRDGVAVLAHDARQHLVPCVATLGGSLLKVMTLAGNHGSGLASSISTALICQLLPVHKDEMFGLDIGNAGAVGQHGPVPWLTNGSCALAVRLVRAVPHSRMPHGLLKLPPILNASEHCEPLLTMRPITTNAQPFSSTMFFSSLHGPQFGLPASVSDISYVASATNGRCDVGVK